MQKLGGQEALVKERQNPYGDIIFTGGPAARAAGLLRNRPCRDQKVLLLPCSDDAHLPLDQRRLRQHLVGALDTMVVDVEPATLNKPLRLPPGPRSGAHAGINS